MPTTGPMIVAQLEISLGDERQCLCGRTSPLFYRVWVGIGGEANREPDEFLCSFCNGERVQVTPFLFGHKLMLLPDPKAQLTDEERADVCATLAQGFDLRAWALRFGQGALPYRAKHNTEWEKLAEFQWAKCKADARLTVARALYEGKFEFIERKDMRLVQVKTRRTPTEREVAILEETRESWCRDLEPLVSADLDLVWVKPQNEAARTELQVTVAIPNGGLRRLFYALPEVPKP